MQVGNPFEELNEAQPGLRLIVRAPLEHRVQQLSAREQLGDEEHLGRGIRGGILWAYR